MRIHTNLTRTEIDTLAYGIDGVYVDATEHGSRSRARAFDFHLLAEQRKGRRRANSGNYGAGYEYAATWDEWGIVFARLFALDPEALCWAYDGVADFHFQTADRFAPFAKMTEISHNRWVFPSLTEISDFTPHDQHRWDFDPETTASDVWSYDCKCGARKRLYRRTRQVTVT